MIVSLDESLRAFRAEVRDFVAANLPSDLAWRFLNGSYLGGHRDMMTWSSILHRKGWSVPHWPVEHGGTGWNAEQHFIFNEEMKRAGAPPMPFQGPILVGPVVIAVGSEAQKKRFLPPIVRGETAWCQGFSEPGAGSDLASLKTVAIRKDDHYVVRGQKLWTSGAHEADWGFFLVRTNPEVKAQKGISFLLVDMKSPGVTVRPVVFLNGLHHTNEVFLDDVVVPAENLVGEENKGWEYAKTLLGAERTASAEVHWTKFELEKLKAIARAEISGGRPLMENPQFRRKVVRLELAVLALEYSVLRVLAGENARYDAGAITSSLKIRGSELMQRVTELQVEALGPKGIRYFDAEKFPHNADECPQDPIWPAYAISKLGQQVTLRATTIFGGAKEVQKNLIARAAFGL